MQYIIREITETDPAWDRLIEVVASLGQTAWMNAWADHFRSSHVLAALADGEPVGFLRFVVQRLGEGEERPPIQFEGQPLTEAKVIAFAVVADYRNRGIGRALQEKAMQQAQTLGCYQLRSRSNYANAANFHLKISMGFGVQPSLKDDSVYFVKTLQ